MILDMNFEATMKWVVDAYPERVKALFNALDLGPLQGYVRDS